MANIFKRVFFLFAGICAMSSCATVFYKKKVYASSVDKKVTVFTNDVYTDEYTGTTVRKHRPLVVTSMRNGYKTSTSIIKPKRFDPMVLLTMALAATPGIGGGVQPGTNEWLAIALPAIGYGGIDAIISAGKHRKRYQMEELEMLPHSKFNDINVSLKPGLDTLVFNPGFPIFYENYKAYKKDKRTPVYTGGGVFYESANWMHQTLSDLGYVNVQKELISNYNKSLVIDAEILSSNEYLIHELGSFVSLTVRFTFYDIYENELSSVDFTTKSAIFGKRYYFSGYHRSLPIRDALTNAFALALASDEFTNLYNNVLGTFNSANPTTDSTLVKTPLEKSPDFFTMANAQITIDGDGYHGSGCLISPDGLAITSHRVVGNKDEVDILFSNGVTKKAKVIKKDPGSNLVLLDSDTTGVSSLKLSKSTFGRIGENVYCVGSPVNKALSQSMSSGIVSGYREQNGIVFLQTDAKISNGNNGSPLIDENGFVIGIVNEKYLGVALEGLSFAVSAENIIKGLNLNTEY